VEGRAGVQQQCWAFLAGQPLLMFPLTTQWVPSSVCCSTAVFCWWLEANAVDAWKKYVYGKRYMGDDTRSCVLRRNAGSAGWGCSGREMEGPGVWTGVLGKKSWDHWDRSRCK